MTRGSKRLSHHQCETVSLIPSGPPERSPPEPARDEPRGLALEGRTWEETEYPEADKVPYFTNLPQFHYSRLLDILEQSGLLSLLHFPLPVSQ